MESVHFFCIAIVSVFFFPDPAQAVATYTGLPFVLSVFCSHVLLLASFALQFLVT